MTTEEGNNIIAEFMELQWNHNCHNFRVDGYGWLSVEMLKYHSSWDWLMPVVKKCCQKNKNKPIGIFNENDFYVDDILAVHQSCIKFIQWYK